MSSTRPRFWWPRSAIEADSIEFVELCERLAPLERHEVTGYVVLMLDRCSLHGKRTFDSLAQLSKFTGVPETVLEEFHAARFHVVTSPGGTNGRRFTVRVPQTGDEAIGVDTVEDGAGTVEDGVDTVEDGVDTPPTTAGRQKNRGNRSRVEQRSSQKSSSERDEETGVPDATPPTDPEGSAASPSGRPVPGGSRGTEVVVPLDPAHPLAGLNLKPEGMTGAGRDEQVETIKSRLRELKQLEADGQIDTHQLMHAENQLSALAKKTREVLA